MSTLIERRDARKAEAEALANTFNAANDQINKLKQEIQQKEKENSQVYADFTVKNAQYAELEQMIKEEEGVNVDLEAPQEG
jgi:septal ring factor EnvC (AmiA/AmiB activator)